MQIQRLCTQNFRNLGEELNELCGGINILCGHNAAGKTNTLEALFMFASGKSFRTSKEKELICRGKDYFVSELAFEKAGVKRNLKIMLAANGTASKKTLYVEGQPVQRASDFLGQFRAVLFTPDHLGLIKGGPEERRRLIDMTLCQIKPRYARALNDYEKILSDRNAYLKKVKLGLIGLDSNYLDVLSELLASAGAVISRQRSLFCQQLSQSACFMYSALTDEKENLCVRYVGFSKKSDYSDEQSNKSALKEVYAKSKERDLSLGRTFYGPHRDELMIFISDNPKKFELDALKNAPQEAERYIPALSECAARSFGSQGQQRSAVLALKLSEGEIIKQLTGEYPVFLLDEVLSELDDGRKQRLMKLLCDRQTVITSCDVPECVRGAEVIRVDGGKYSVKSEN